MSDMLVFLQTYSGVLAIAVTVVTLLLSTKFVTCIAHEKAVSSLDGKFVIAIDKLDKAEDRIAKLENEFRHLPDRDSVHRIQLALSELKGELRAVGEQLKPVASISERLQEFLLEQASRK